ncbi:serine hydrolase domain-containing protein [Natronospora cellulosivora (SeqCode)]
MNNLKIHEKPTEYTAEDVGYIGEKISILDEHFKKIVAEKRIQGASYIISRYGKVFAHKSMGKLRSEEDDDRDLLPDSIRRIASITKIFTAVAIMQLVERGKMRIHQPVMDFLDEFKKPPFDKITIFNFLTHTSGICPDPGAYFEPYPANWGWYDNEAWITEILRGHTRINTGEWSYSSSGYSLLGEIIKRVSGISYQEYIRKNILEPLDMKDSGFGIDDIIDDKEAIEKRLERVCFNWNFTEEELDKWIERERNRPDWASPPAGGGLFSTLEDLQKFGQMLLNKGTFNGKQLVSRKGVEALTRNHLKDVKDYCWGTEGAEKEYGLGFRVHSNFLLLSPGTFSHEGAGLCALYMDPVEDLLAAYFCPLTGDEWVEEAVNNTLNIIWSGLI